MIPIMNVLSVCLFVVSGDLQLAKLSIQVLIGGFITANLNQHVSPFIKCILHCRLNWKMQLREFYAVCYILDYFVVSS